MRKYGVDVINFVPGSFTASSNLMARQVEFGEQQRQALSEEQRQFYGDYFDRFHARMKFISGEHPIEIFDEKDGMMQTFTAALLDAEPRAKYLYEPDRR